MLRHDATLIDLQAEGMWPTGTHLKWTITTLVVGPASGGGAAVQRADVDLVLRDDGGGVVAARQMT